jgi:hypothetical protein
LGSFFADLIGVVFGGRFCGKWMVLVVFWWCGGGEMRGKGGQEAGCYFWFGGKEPGNGNSRSGMTTRKATATATAKGTPPFRKCAKGWGTRCFARWVPAVCLFGGPVFAL